MDEPLKGWILDFVGLAESPKVKIFAASRLHCTTRFALPTVDQTCFRTWRPNERFEQFERSGCKP
jgi:hypothetical protein